MKIPLKSNITFFLITLLAVFCAEVLFKFYALDFNLLFSSNRILILSFTIFSIHLFSVNFLKDYKLENKNILFFFIVFVLNVFIASFGVIIADAFTSYLKLSNLNFTLESISFRFLIPFATGTLIIQSLLGLSYALVYSLIISISFSIYFPNSILILPFVLSTSLVGALTLEKFRNRSSFIKAGFNIGLIGFPFALSAIMLNYSANLSLIDFILILFSPFMGGIICSMIAFVLMLIFEYIGGYSTDMKLIEMSTLDHPLLKELSISAPGTWSHSTVISMMVESAANEIGANPVLCKVGSFFHDIGKMKKPSYFVENQSGGENKHDKLSPSMSSLIIRSHVKDGLELANEYRLPAAIKDLIAQHHGTSVIEYFYDKAKKENPDQDVDISLYTYPGPKPQTREAGLLMLADTIEPATKSISEPTLDRIQGVVQKMINKIFASGELNECDLTLKDLHKIAKCFTRVLNGKYHHRIAYSEPASKGKEIVKDEKNGKKLEPTNTNSKEKQSEHRKPKKENDENLKRLGIDEESSKDS